MLAGAMDRVHRDDGNAGIADAGAADGSKRWVCGNNPRRTSDPLALHPALPSSLMGFVPGDATSASVAPTLRNPRNSLAQQ